MWPKKRVPISTRILAVVSAIFGSKPLLPSPKAAEEPEEEPSENQKANDLIENVYDAHALPKVGDRIFIVLDRATGELTSKMGVFAGFGTLPAGGTDGEIRVGDKRIRLNEAIWLTCPDQALEMMDVFASVVGFVREEIALSTREDYDLTWGMNWN